MAKNANVMEPGVLSSRLEFMVAPLPIPPLANTGGAVARAMHRTAVREGIREPAMFEGPVDVGGQNVIQGVAVVYLL